MPRVTRSAASEQQVANYLESGLQTQVALESAIRLLKARQTITGDADESRQIAVSLLGLQSELARVQSEILAFLSEQASIEPPGDEDVRRVKQSVRALDQMTANANAANVVLATVTDVLQRWNRTR